MRIAHLSDLHLLNLEGASPLRFLNKRMTGYLNLRFHRKAVHKPSSVRAAARAIRELGVDHVVVTGDVTNLALEGEFELVRDVLSSELGFSPDKLSLVPGNHDMYTGGAFRTQRFVKMFAENVTSDLPDLRPKGSAFPFVRLRGPAAIVGLSTAVPRMPFVASGTIGREQLEALAKIVEHPEVRARTLVVLQHHPLHNSQNRAKVLIEGLLDAELEQRILGRLERGLVLHGHLHRRVRRDLATRGGVVHAVGAPSASLVDARDERMGGFNLYEIGDDGAVQELGSRRLDLETSTFREVAIPVAA